METRRIACPHCSGLKVCACEVCGTGPRGVKKLGVCKVCEGKGYSGIEVFPSGEKDDSRKGEKGNPSRGEKD
jgi:hypothetical protein